MGVGLLVALCYNVFAAVLGYFAASTVASLTRLTLPAWVYMTLALALTSMLALFHIELTAKVLGVQMVGEVLVLAVGVFTPRVGFSWCASRCLVVGSAAAELRTFVATLAQPPRRAVPRGGRSGRRARCVAALA